MRRPTPGGGRLPGRIGLSSTSKPCRLDVTTCETADRGRPPSLYTFQLTNRAIHLLEARLVFPPQQGGGPTLAPLPSTPMSPRTRGRAYSALGIHARLEGRRSVLSQQASGKGGRPSRLPLRAGLKAGP